MLFSEGYKLAPVAAALGLLHLGLLLLLLLYRGWRRAAARQEEVRRMMRLAAAEERRLEMEASMAYMRAYSEFVATTTGKVVQPTTPVEPERVTPAIVVTPVEPERVTPATVVAPPPPLELVCALCFKPATARCARCKAIRYCSGKCQIIHWRQGHKDECCLPSTNNDYTSQKLASDLRRSETERSGIGADFEIKQQPHGNAVQNARERPDSDFVTSHRAFTEDGKPVHIPIETKSNTDGDTATSVPGDTTLSHGTATNDASNSARLDFRQDVRLENTSPVSSSNHRSAGDAYVHSKPSSAAIAGSHEKNNFDSSRKKSDVSRSEEAECMLIDQSDDAISTNRHTSIEHPKKTDEGLVIELDENNTQGPLAKISSGTCDKTRNTTLPTSESTSGSKLSEKEDKTVEKSDSLAALKINNTKLVKERAAEFYDAASLSQKVDIARPPITLLDSASSVPKPSVMRVVNQFTSKVSRSYPSEMMLFPYNLFIELYNDDKVELRPCGLTNYGNSCYANAVLQCLEFTRPLTAYFLGGLHSRTCLKKEACFTCEFERLLMSAKQGKSPLSPSGVLSYLEKNGTKFSQGKQEDAHEFLRYAIDVMQSVCLKEAGAEPGGPLAEESTLIQQTFGGYLRSKIKCGGCKSMSERSERMMDLTLEIDGDIVSLEQALSRFTSTEILDGENKYKCDRCKSYERAKKKLTILEAPNVLTIALKRFQSGSIRKLDKAVRFPEYLDLAPYMSKTDDKSPIYGLYAVIVHIDATNSSISGHYVSYVKDMQGKWYHTDDSKVKAVELKEVLSQGAYMLLYARFSPRAPSSVRKAMADELVRIRKARSREAKGKLNSVFSRHGPSVASRSHHFLESASSNRPSERVHQPMNDTFSDTSSLFSYSNEDSWSTDSTRDSTTTDELWARNSGEFVGLNSPLSIHEESDAFTDSPFSSRHSLEAVFSGRLPDYINRELDEPGIGYMKPRDSRGVWVEGADGLFFLYTDQNKHLGEVLDDTDWINPRGSDCNVFLRRPSRDRTSQIFY